MFQIVLCNCPDAAVANNIAKRLVNDKLAACVNIVPQISSVYMWQDEVVDEQEIMLLIKSKQTLFNDIEALINQLHPYDVPEVISLDITKGNAPYLQWLNESVK